MPKDDLWGAQIDGLPKNFWRQFWRQYAVTLLIIVLLGFVVSFFQSVANSSIDIWRMLLFSHIPFMREAEGSALEMMLSGALTLVMTGFIAWGWLYFRGKRRANVAGKLRKLQPVFVRHAKGRWQLGFRLNKNTVAFEDSGEENDFPMDPIYMPSFPLPVTGQLEFINRDSYALVHNKWEDIALFFARGGVAKVRWLLTDTEGNKIDAKKFLTGDSPLIERDE